MPETEGETKAEAPLLVCLGAGYVAGYLARRLKAQGWRIVGVRRTPQHPGEITLEQAAPFIGEARAILASIPPGEGGDPALSVQGEALAKAEGAWIGYLSTTGVYGDRAGRWAFEDDPPTPQSPEGRRRAAAEQGWRALGAHVFRLPGVYGPGRSPFAKLKAGLERLIDKPGQVFSRAHPEDIAAALALAMERPNPGRIYNICDDEPAPSAAVVAHAAKLLGLPPPPLVGFEEADLNPMARRFYSECKRVSNARAKAELGWRLIYPTYREGLRAILQAESAAQS